MHTLKFYLLALLLMPIEVYAVTKINYMVIQDQAQPFQNHQNKKHHNGIITDIVKEIFPAPEYDLNIHTLPFNRMIKTLEQGKFENWITFGSPNWPGVQSLNLSQLPVFNVQHSLLTAKQHQFDINSAKDLFGKTVILLHGFDYPGLEEHISNKDINAIKVKSYSSAFKVVNRLKDKAGFVEMTVRINYNLKEQNLASEDYNLLNFSSVIADYNLHLAMAPDMDAKVQNHINEQLNKMQRSGKLKGIIDTY